MNLQPTTPEEVQAIVQAQQAILPCGGRTKTALSTVTNGQVNLDMSQLSGIIEYEPGEYTFTAYAGTPVQQVITELAKEGQYLPFDPVLIQRGATLGGTVAANSGGAGRYRYGGVRDFILGVRFVDGQGQLVRSGGKVVKNSAGFDLSKFMVGSLGRYGVLVELTFKVFPEPRAYATLKATYPSLGAALQTISRLFTAPFDMDAFDLFPVEAPQFALLIRFGSLADALPNRANRLQDFLKTHTATTNIELIQGQTESQLWVDVREFTWVDDGLALVKVPISPRRVSLLENVVHRLNPSRRYSAGGNVAWLATSTLDELDVLLKTLGLVGLVMLGVPGRPYLGLRKGMLLAQRVKQALDPTGKFLEA